MGTKNRSHSNFCSITSTSLQ